MTEHTNSKQRVINKYKDIQIKSINDINFLYINTVSLRNKLDDIELLLNDIGIIIHIICLSEVRISLSEKRYYNIPNYTSYFSCRNSNIKKSGGGVGMFIREGLNCNIVKSYGNDFDNFLLIYINNIKLNVGVFYRPPDSNNTIFMDQLQYILTPVNSLIFCDANINLLDEGNLIYKNYKDTLTSSGYYILNKYDKVLATRICKSNSTIIDHMLTNVPSDIYNFNTHLMDHYISDHRINITNVNKLKINQTVNVNALNSDSIKIINYKQISNHLKNNPILLNNQLNCNDLYNSFLNQLKTVVVKFTYTKENRKKNCKYFVKDWMTNEIYNLIKIRNKYFNLKNKYPNNDLYIKLCKELSNKITKLKRKAKLLFFAKHLNSIKNQKEFWQITNKLIYNKFKHKDKDKNIPQKIKNEKGVFTENTKEILNIANDFFCNVGAKMNSNVDKNNLIPVNTEYINTESNLHLYPTDTNEIKLTIKNLKLNTAAGYDNLNSKLFKICDNELAKPLQIIINTAFKSGVYPDMLKIARVVPIFKDGDKSDISNYRPISILSIICKIIDKILEFRLIKFLNEINFMNKDQYGFCPKSNTEAATFEVINDVQKKLDSNPKLISAMLFIDLSKAFDSVNPDNLLNKIFKLGIKNKPFDLLKSYFCNRKQYIKHEEFCSEYRNIKFGCPQGAVHSPLFFNLYINDLSRLLLKGKLIKYADDICLVYFGSDLNSITLDIQHDLDLLDNWFRNNYLSINVNKTKFMVIKRGEKLIVDKPPNINGNFIEQVLNYKYLGLNIDYELKWTVHIDNIKKKILPIIGVLWRLKNCIPEKIKNNIYNSFVNSHLNYLVGIWGNAYETALNPIKTIQCKALKMIHNIDYYTTRTEVFTMTQVLNLNNLNYKNLCVFLYKVQNNLIKNELNITLNSDIHSHNTRYANNYHIDFTRTNLGKFSILIKAIHLFNNLPTYIKDSLSIIEFKKKIKIYLLSIQNEDKKKNENHNNKVYFYNG